MALNYNDVNFSKLKFDLDRSKISIRELCRRVNITNAGLYRSIKDETMNVKTFEKICNELKLNPSEYFELDHELPLSENTTLKKLKLAEELFVDLKQELLKTIPTEQSENDI